MQRIERTDILLADMFLEKPKPIHIYSGLVVGFLGELSKTLMADGETKKYPDVVTFAFWCRESNLNRLEAWHHNKNCIGRGRVLHICPSNVPTVFAYSFAWGLLSGNSNIVKLPSRLYPQVKIICDAIEKLFKRDCYIALGKQNELIQYDKENTTLTEELSLLADVRIVWGSDKTIAHIRSVPTKPRCVDVMFPDRYSLCIIDTNAPFATGLAQKFYNDTYTMDQNACSSPRLIVWTGNRVKEFKKYFWDSLDILVRAKYTLTQKQVSDKYTKLRVDAIELDELINSISVHGTSIYRVNLSELPENIDSLKADSGYFYEYETNDINSTVSIVNEKYQTLTYYGNGDFKNVLTSFVINNSLTGIDRIVPIGQALSMGVLWDGYDIIRTLSRIVDVK